MASKKKPSAPLTFDLGIGLLRKIEDYQKKAGVASKSEVIRDAIDTFDYDGYSPETEPHRQISVRLPAKQKRDLARIAKRKKVSLGELLRVALRALPDDPPAKEKDEPKAAAKPKKSGRKTAAKKTTSKSASSGKTTVRRAAAKSAPARSATKRTTTSRTTKRGSPRRSVARKASSPRTTSRKPAKKS
ncbi:MAG TPA: ribbon-helix-helix protein, CopG family [Opitutales bacterium]|nr:ribbon-helix-helix protein, CopG family [Opitutales bacterium]